MALPTLSVLHALCNAQCRSVAVPDTYVFVGGCLQGRFSLDPVRNVLTWNDTDWTASQSVIGARTASSIPGQNSGVVNAERALRLRVYENLVMGAAGDIVAVIVYDTTQDQKEALPVTADQPPIRNATAARSSNRVSVEFLSASRTAQFIHDPTFTGLAILSKFTVAGDAKLSLANCVWADDRLIGVERRINRHRLDDVSLPVAVRTATSAAESQHNLAIPVSQGATERLAKLSRDIVRAVSFGNPYAAQLRMGLYFMSTARLSDTGVGRWLFFCASECPEAWRRGDDGTWDTALAAADDSSRVAPRSPQSAAASRDRRSPRRAHTSHSSRRGGAAPREEVSWATSAADQNQSAGRHHPHTTEAGGGREGGVRSPVRRAATPGATTSEPLLWSLFLGVSPLDRVKLIEHANALYDGEGGGQPRQEEDISVNHLLVGGVNGAKRSLPAAARRQSPLTSVTGGMGGYLVSTRGSKVLPSPLSSLVVASTAASVHDVRPQTLFEARRTPLLPVATASTSLSRPSSRRPESRQEKHPFVGSRPASRSPDGGVGRSEEPPSNRPPSRPPTFTVAPTSLLGASPLAVRQRCVSGQLLRCMNLDRKEGGQRDEDNAAGVLTSSKKSGFLHPPSGLHTHGSSSLPSATTTTKRSFMDRLLSAYDGSMLLLDGTTGTPPEHRSSAAMGARGSEETQQLRTPGEEGGTASQVEAKGSPKKSGAPSSGGSGAMQKKKASSGDEMPHLATNNSTGGGTIPEAAFILQRYDPVALVQLLSDAMSYELYHRGLLGKQGTPSVVAARLPAAAPAVDPTRSPRHKPGSASSMAHPSSSQLNASFTSAENASFANNASMTSSTKTSTVEPSSSPAPPSTANNEVMSVTLSLPGHQASELIAFSKQFSHVSASLAGDGGELRNDGGGGVAHTVRFAADQDTSAMHDAEVVDIVITVPANFYDLSLLKSTMFRRAQALFDFIKGRSAAELRRIRDRVAANGDGCFHLVVAQFAQNHEQVVSQTLARLKLTTSSSAL